MTRRAAGTGRQNGVDLEARKIVRSFDWRTTDEEEIALRQQRVREEQPRIRNVDSTRPIFSRFEIHSPSGMIYSVEVRLHGCTAVLVHLRRFSDQRFGYLQARGGGVVPRRSPFFEAFVRAKNNGSNRIDIVWNAARKRLQIENPDQPLPKPLAKFFDTDGMLLREVDPERALDEPSGT